MRCALPVRAASGRTWTTPLAADDNARGMPDRTTRAPTAPAGFASFGLDDDIVTQLLRARGVGPDVLVGL